MLSRLGPAPLPLLCAFLVLALAALGALVPVGRQGQTLEVGQALTMAMCGVALATWSVAVGASAWQLTGVERTGAVLVPTMSPGAFDLLFSMPLVFVVPGSALAILPLLRGVRPAPAGLFALLFWVGLLALRETDQTAYVRDGRLQVRKGWLWVRRESTPLAQVTGVRVDRDVFRGAPSFVVKFDLVDAGALPRLTAMEMRFRSEEKARAEAERWRQAIGQLRGGS